MKMESIESIVDIVLKTVTWKNIDTSKLDATVNAVYPIVSLFSAELGLQLRKSELYDLITKRAMKVGVGIELCTPKMDVHKVKKLKCKIDRPLFEESQIATGVNVGNMDTIDGWFSDIGDVGIDPVELSDRMDWIEKQPFIEQRSPEWYKYRNSLITASAASNIFDTDACRKAFLREKTSPSTFRSGGGAATEHGIMFEDVAIGIYERRLKDTCKVGEYGCIRHAHIPHLGASPDGIITHGPRRGVMLEIKCPYTRQITGIPKEEYWIQVQLQLEVCNLELCDFLECAFEKYDSFDLLVAAMTRCKTEYGIIVTTQETVDKSGKKHWYSPISLPFEELSTWHDSVVDASIATPGVRIIKTTYWSLKKLNVCVIKRCRKWFESIKSELEAFWSEVIARRNDPDALESDRVIAEKREREKEKKSMIDDLYTSSDIWLGS